jgi:hypothetical protein
MKSQYVILCSFVLISFLLLTGCKKDSVSQGPPSIVVAQKPSISAISPDTALAGALITITGKNFSTTAANDTVRFNGMVATVVTATATQLTVNAPAGGSTGNIIITTADGVSNGVNFIYATATSGPDIYVAGFDGVHAVYWKNGTEVVLTDGTKQAVATSICISNNDVYVAGYEGLVAKYWKNGTAIALTSGSLPARATGIAVSGNNVAVSGFMTSTLGLDYTYAALWYNGVLTGMAEDTIHPSVANSLVLQGNLPTVSGFVTGIHGYNVGRAFLHSPGTLVDYLTNDTTASNATSSCIAPSDGMYAAGYISPGGNVQPQVWADGLPLYHNYFGYPGYAYGIAVDSANQIYAVGTSMVPGKKAIAEIWKGVGGAGTDLTDGTNPAGAYGVATHGTDVYVAGFEYQSGGGYGAPKIWKNGVGTTLPANNSTAGAYAIVVK